MSKLKQVILSIALLALCGADACSIPIRAFILDIPEFYWATTIESGAPLTNNRTTLSAYVMGIGAVNEYRYVIGPAASTSCLSSASYSAWTSKNIQLNINFAALPDGQIRFCVVGRGTDAKGRAVQQAPIQATKYLWIKDTTGPGTFSITSPASVSNDDTPTVAWTAASGAANYALKVATTANCAAGTVVANFPTNTATNRTLGSLADGTYYTCVSASDSIGNTVPATNDGRSFQIDTVAPNAFNILTPNGTVGTLTPMASWEVAAGANTYDVKVTTDAAGTNVVDAHPGMPSTSAQLALPLDGFYYIFVDSFDAAGNMRAAAPQQFTVQLLEPQEVNLRFNSGYPSSPAPWIDDVTSTPLPVWSLITYGEWATSGVKFSSPNNVALSSFAGVFVPLPNAFCGGDFSKCCGQEPYFDCYSGRWRLNVWGPSAQYSTAQEAYRQSPLAGNVASNLPLSESGFIPYGGSWDIFPTYYQTLALAEQDRVNLSANVEYIVGVVALANLSDDAAPGAEVYLAGSTYSGGFSPDLYCIYSDICTPYSDLGSSSFDIFGFEN